VLSGCFAAGFVGSSGLARAAEIIANSGREDVEDLIREHGLAQVNEAGAIEAFCDQAIAANPGPAEDYRKGKMAALNFLKGQVMKLSKGKANAALAGEILERKLRG
jgi:aspartyl-tRNA(Asn)/glutamyl-tRNA(Gln) amidotransferase subunit B